MMTKNRRFQEERRLKAIRMFENQIAVVSISMELQVTPTSVQRWKSAWKKGEDLHAKETPGRPMALDKDQLAELAGFLNRSPNIKPFRLVAWIEKQFGVKYCTDQAYRLKKRLLRGWRAIG